MEFIFIYVINNQGKDKKEMLGKEYDRLINQRKEEEKELSNKDFKYGKMINTKDEVFYRARCHFKHKVDFYYDSRKERINKWLKQNGNQEK